MTLTWTCTPSMNALAKNIMPVIKFMITPAEMIAIR